MLTVHLLGHVHVSLDRKPVHLSAKATALLAYLALQRAPQHREHLADLLWESHDALGNLRVELARLRSQGLALFPARQPMLTLQCDTDLQQFLHREGDMSEQELTEWLSLARGIPLAGLEDLGSTDFQEWVESQRWIISEQVEKTLARAYTRHVEGKQERSAELIRARAEHLGLASMRLVPTGGLTLPRFDRPEARTVLNDVLSRAEREPRLLLLGGRSGSGKRSLLQEAVQGSEWLLLQVNALPGRRLMQAAIAQSLLKAAPTARDVLQNVLLHPGEPDDDLIRIASVLVALSRPVVLAIHGADNAGSDLRRVLEFMLGLPMPLLLVLSSTQPHVWPDLIEGTDAGRTHRLDLNSITVAATMRALRPTQQGLDGDALHARAARLVQQGDGWPLHMRALLEAGVNLSAGRAPLPDTVREALLADAATWPGELRHALARLAMMYTPFDVPRASALLGEDAARVLEEGVRLGILTPAAPCELVHLPDLRYTPSDLETCLGFASEPLRTVLAGSLSGTQRGALRAQLAQLLIGEHPEVSAYYAERAGLDDLAASARERSGQRQDPPCTAQRGAAGVRVRGASEPAPGGGARRERLTGNGYRVSVECGRLEILRLGRFAPPPRLRLACPPVPGGTWRMVARIDVFRDASELSTRELAYPLALQVGAGERLVFALEGTRPAAVDDAAHRVVPGVPLGKWFEVSGTGGAGPLELGVRALDVAVTVGLLEWGGTLMEW